MISLGSNDARKGLGLGFGGREMEDTELEEGEACSYNNNNDDYDATTEPENDLSSLSYIDEKIQHVLGHFQKDFEGGVSAENLGAKFGGYGSFLPTYPRSPGWSNAKSLPKVQSSNSPRSPNNVQLEDGHRKSACWAIGSQSLRPGPPTSLGTLPALKAPSLNDSIKQEVSMTSTHADELASRSEFANKKPATLPDQKTLKLRIKVGSDNLSTRKNAAIYSGLGLDVSPSSSLDDSPSESEGMYRDTQEPLLESPTSILRFMTSFPVPGESLLSPLPDDLLNFGAKEKIRKENISDSAKGDGVLLGDRKAKSVEKKDFPAERKSGNNREIKNDNGIMSKKEIDMDTLACEELVSKTLKLPLLSNSYSAVDKLKSKGSTRTRGDVAIEETVEPILAQEIGWENPRPGSARKVLEEQKTSVLDDISGYTRKDGYNKGEKTYDLIKDDSNTPKGSKALNSEPVDPPKQKASQSTSHGQENMKLPTAKEHTSSGGKRKSKAGKGHRSLAGEVPKENLRVGSSSTLKNKQNAHVNNYANKKESGDWAEDRYRDFFGDMGESEQEENQTNSLEICPEDRLKEAEKTEKNISAVNNAYNDRLSGKRTEDLFASESYPKATMDGASNTANVNIAGTSHATAAPVLIKENWVSCDKCLKWRLLPLSINPVDLPDKWLCSMLNWLPGMNRCSVDEEETTKAVFALYQAPAGESQTHLQTNPVSIMSRLPYADALQPDQNQRSFGSSVMPSTGRKKHSSKEISNAMDKDGPTSMKKNVQSSLRSGSLTDVIQSPAVGEHGLQHLSKSCDLSVEKHKQKQKEKHKASEHSSDGGDAKTSKMKGKRITDQDPLRASKKIKTEGSHQADEDWAFKHTGKGGASTSNGFPTTLMGKSQSKHGEHSSKDSKLDKKDRQEASGKRPKDKVQVSLNDGSVDLGNFDGAEVSRKRKVDECNDNQLYTGSLQSMGNHLQDSRMCVKEEFSENDHRRDKKARVSKSGGKDSSASKSSGKPEKKSRHTKNHRSGQDPDSTLSQRSLDGTDSLKRDFGSSQPSLAATSSSSKVSGSHKSKPGFHEAKGSPVESVSSSPMRIANPDKLPSTRRFVSGRDDSRDTGLFVAGSPRRSSDGEDNGGTDRSGTRRKEKSSAAAQPGSLGSSVIDLQDKDGGQLGGNKAKGPVESSPDIRKDKFLNGTVEYLGQEVQHAAKSTMDEQHDAENQNDNHGNATVSRSRKSGKGSSRSKERSHNFKSDSVDEEQDRTPLHEVKCRDGRNKYQERLGVKSDESDNRLVDDKESVGKLSCENSKRDGQSNVAVHNRSDAKPDVSGSQDVMSTVKQNIVPESDGDKYSKRFHPEKSDHAETASGRGNSVSLPPAGGTQNEMPARCPRPVSGSQKANGVDGSQGDDALKVQKQIKKADNQNGTQHGSSRQTTSSGRRIRDVDAPSPLRKDSSSQAATNALKEAKDLKHMADRVKNSGSNVESTGLYFQAALKFLHGASLLESSGSETAKHGELIQYMQIYRSTAKLCEFCAHEYERLKDMAAASLAYKCMEVAYMRVIYSSHANASKDRHELQRSLQMAPPGESPSSASDVDNLNHHTTGDKAACPKGVSPPQVAGNHVISAQHRPNFVRLLSFAQDVNYAMEASRKSRLAFAAANISLAEAESGEVISSVKKALDFNFQDVEVLLRLVRLAMEAISH